MTSPARLRLQQVSLPIKDGEQPEVRAFYGKALGMTEQPVPPAVAHYGFVWFAAGANNLQLHFIPDLQAVNPAEERHLCLETEDLDDVRQRLVDAGRAPFETFPVPGRRRFFCRDPFGLLLEFATPLKSPGDEP